MSDKFGEVDIVIIEDNPSDAELVRRVLRKHLLDSTCLLLEDGAEALDYFFCEGRYAGTSRQPSPKVILLDLKLPKVDGFEVLRRIKSDERTRGIPVVALTSSAEQQDLRTAYGAGVNSFVTKPIEFSRFSALLVELGRYWVNVNQLPNA